MAVLRRWSTCALVAGVVLASWLDAFAQAPVASQGSPAPPPAAPRPAVEAGALDGSIRLDGRLDEALWQQAPRIDNLTMSEPTPGAEPTGRTVVRVLADRKALVIGVRCEDPDPAGIVSFTKARDGALQNEDHVKVVLDTFQDGRSGYVFAVNPGGARYDALVEPGGETENANWDGLWEAATSRDEGGWSLEIRIPITTLSFRKGAASWYFNVQRRIQRLQEINRWSGWSRDYKVTQTSHAGELGGLPEFDLGVGLTVRPAVTTGGGVPAPEADVDGSFQPSLDVTQRLGSNLLGSLTVNTDFAETEVDTRRTNLTRFPLFFPEKRTFFLEGSDIFAFGLGLGESMRPYYSRRIGLVSGREVPILAGGKVNGRVSGTNLGAQIVRTSDVDGVAPDATMGVVRVKQNVLAESSVGVIATAGDPRGRTGSWLVGGDATYQTSRMKGDKNFLLGLWGIAMGRDGLGPDASAYGVSLDYPNDLWDTVVKYLARGAGLRSVDWVRGAAGRARIRFPDGVQAETGLLEHPADVRRVRDLARHRPRRPVGELPRVHGAGELAVRKWRPRRVQLGPYWRAPRRPLRSVAGRRDSARVVPLDAVPPRGRHRLEAALQRPVHVVVRRVLRGHAPPGHLDRRVEPGAAGHHRVRRRIRRRPPRHRRLHHHAGRHAAAPEPLAGPHHLQLRPVRHAEQVGRAPTRASAGPSGRPAISS